MTATKHHKPVSLASLGGMAIVTVACLQMFAGAEHEDHDPIPRRRMLRAAVEQVQTQPSASTAKQCYPACVFPKFCVNGDCAQRVNSDDKQTPKDMGSSKPSGYLFVSDPGSLHPGEVPSELISEAQPPSP